MKHRPSAQIHRLRRDESGSTAIMFSVTFGAVMLMMGAAVDYSRTSSQQSRLQAASDATILGLARQGNLSQSELSTKAAQLLTSNMQGDPNARLAAGPDHRNNAVELCIDTTTKVSASIMQIAKITDITVKATSCAAVSDAYYEIALVLDNSGSMSEWAGNDSKIGAAKSAANTLVDKLTVGTNQSAIAAVSVVPFAASVNIGPQYRSSSFMDLDGLSSIHWQNVFNPTVAGATWRPANRFGIYDKIFNANDFSTGTAWSGCVEERPGNYFLSDAKAVATDPNSLYVPMFAPDEPSNATNSYLSDTGGTCASGDAYELADIANGDGSGRSRMCKYNLSSKLSSSYASKANYSCTTKSLQPLTQDMTAAKSKIAEMAAGGNTSIAQGLAWGWRTISPNTPFTPGASSPSAQQLPAGYGARLSDGRLVKKVVILMTDGDNTWGSNSYSYTKKLSGGSTTWASTNTGRYGPYGYWQNARGGTTPTSDTGAVDQMDSYVRSVCDKIKASGVTIYTVAFGTSISTDGQSLLQSCATDTGKYFSPATSSEIISSFQTIADSLQVLHLTR